MTTTTNDLQDFLSKTIYHWVGRNFGSQEADDPSWNIEALSKYLAKELNTREREITGTKPYELTVLLPTSSSIDLATTKIKRTIERAGGRVVSLENEGEKRLAYSIQGKEYAIYLYFNIELPEGKATEVSSVLNIDDDVLRYLMVKADTGRR